MIAAFLLALLAAAPTPFPSTQRPQAPHFLARDLSGQRLHLEQWRGKVVVLAFWATWCAPCRQELPHLGALQRRRGADGLMVVAIATDGPPAAAQVGAVARRGAWGVPVVHDADGALAARFNPRGENPMVVVIDRAGRVAFTHQGYTPGDEAALAQVVTALLEER